MEHPMYPESTRELHAMRRELAPEQLAAFRAFSQAAFADGALPTKIKQLIAVAVAHTTQCPYCIRGHTEGALKAGASEAEIMEAIWVAAEMRAGAAYAHSALAIDTMAAHAHAAGTGTIDPTTIPATRGPVIRVALRCRRHVAESRWSVAPECAIASVGADPLASRGSLIISGLLEGM